MNSVIQKWVIILTLFFSTEAAQASPLAENRWTLGWSSTSTFTTSDSLNIGHTFQNSSVDSLIAIPSWEKNFSWTLGGVWKWNIAGTLAKGIHLGPLAGIGESSSAHFFFVGATVGVHYAIDDFVIFSFDGGPTFNSYRGGEIVNFQLKPFGTLLGFGVHVLLQ